MERERETPPRRRTLGAEVGQLTQLRKAWLLLLSLSLPIDAACAAGSSHTTGTSSSGSASAATVTSNGTSGATSGSTAASTTVGVTSGSSSGSSSTAGGSTGSTSGNALCGFQGACKTAADCPCGLPCTFQGDAGSGQCVQTVGGTCSIDQECGSENCNGVACACAQQSPPWPTGATSCFVDSDCCSGLTCQLGGECYPPPGSACGSQSDCGYTPCTGNLCCFPVGGKGCLENAQCCGGIPCTPGQETLTGAATCCAATHGVCGADGDCCFGSCEDGGCCRHGQGLGAECTSALDCCIGFPCNGGLCCLGPDAGCQSSADCCNNSCVGGACCFAGGNSCSQNSDCCAGLICPGVTGSNVSACCNPTRDAGCSGDPDCCSGSCQGGHCGCVPLRQPCGISADCCNSLSCTGGICCQASGLSCVSDADCCTGSCNNGTGKCG